MAVPSVVRPQRHPSGALPAQSTYLVQAVTQPDAQTAAQLARIEEHLRIVRQWCWWLGVWVPLLIVGLLVIFDVRVLTSLLDPFGLLP